MPQTTRLRVLLVFLTAFSWPRLLLAAWGHEGHQIIALIPARHHEGKGNFACWTAAGLM